MKCSTRYLTASHGASRNAAPQPIAARLRTRIATLLNDVAFLRNLPPDTYVSLTPSTNARHLTAVIDAESTSCPPLTRAAFLLRTEVSDEASSLDECCLVGCPLAQSPAEGHSFVERLLQAGSAHSIPEVHRKLNVTVLPDFHPGVGNVLAALDGATEKPVNVVTDSFTAAYLTDPTFFDGVKHTLVQEHHQRVPWLSHLTFPGVESGRVTVAKTGDKVSLASGHRQLVLWVAPTAAPSKRPAHFQHAPMAVFDKATRTLILGGELGGCRFPWAHWLNRGFSKDAVLPMPHWMHRATVRDHGLSPPLLTFWRPEHDLKRSLDAMRHFTFAQRVVSLSYAELGSDREDVIADLEKATAALVELRKRLSGKVFRMKREDPTVQLRMATASEALCKALLLKVEEEVCSLKRPAEAGALSNGGTASDAAEQCGSDDDRALCVEGLETYALGAVCRSLCCSAIDLAPTEGAALVASSKESTATTAIQELPAADASLSSALPTAESIAILEKVFAKRGFESLTPILREEQIDADVFLAMSSEEMTRTFKLTFGLTKKLQGLQEDLKGRLSKRI